MFVTNWISTTKIQKISEITNFFRHYFLSRTEVIYSLLVCLNINFLRKNLFKMIRLSEIITTFAFELERYEKTCRDEGLI